MIPLTNVMWLMINISSFHIEKERTRGRHIFQQ